MRKGILSALLVCMGMIFSQVALSAEMIRYEHEMYSSKQTKKQSGRAADAWQQKGQQVNYSDKYQHQHKARNKEGHPVFIAFPDRK